ncbi:amidase [Phaeobacter sp. B1627]|uniref:amidase n=1 Tax=Phaeobacter sp. B1627 TaxID=2583809 RepID=UPI001118B5E4|nr:amidase [Phaeobacter sp. B1627]TNJ47770.1 amidase [Phaeobacter sp. B1627]
MRGAEMMSLSAHDVLQRFADHRLTPSDYLAACLERISQVNPRINALTAIDGEGAVAEAVQATVRWRAGTPKGPLDGLPVGVKDLQNTKGLLTTHGSPRMRANCPQDDQPMVARLRAAGAIILAKTNVPECGAGGNSRNPVWGATGNPFDANLIAGGSSGGSAAALAADLLPLCTGSDTGGSLRLPAALCGIVGYRPSVDVIAHPTRPLGWSGISVLGPMARSMDDLLLMLRVCAGYDPDDPLSAPGAPDRFASLPAVSLGALRVGYSEDFGGAPVDPAIRATFRARIDKIAPHVQHCSAVDLALGEMDRCFDILRAESFLSAFGEVVRSDPDAFGPDIATNVALGESMTLADRAWAHAEQTRILRRFNAVMQGFDVILLPTAPVSPFPWTQGHATEIESQSMDIYYRWLALTYRGSLSGGPSITLPCGRDPHGLPFGLQMLGPVRGDEGMLAAATAVERFFAADPDTARPRPDLAALAPPDIDLRSIVTHPPILNSVGRSEPTAMRTAV